MGTVTFENVREVTRTKTPAGLIQRHRLTEEDEGTVGFHGIWYRVIMQPDDERLEFHGEYESDWLEIGQTYRRRYRGPMFETVDWDEEIVTCEP